jgi:hypothetical protein
LAVAAESCGGSRRPRIYREASGGGSLVLAGDVAGPAGDAGSNPKGGDEERRAEELSRAPCAVPCCGCVVARKGIDLVLAPVVLARGGSAAPAAAWGPHPIRKRLSG